MATTNGASVCAGTLPHYLACLLAQEECPQLREESRSPVTGWHPSLNMHASMAASLIGLTTFSPNVALCMATQKLLEKLEIAPGTHQKELQKPNA